MEAENSNLSSVFQCFAHDRRRHVIDFFRDNEDDTVSVDDIVDHIIEQETRSPASTRDRIIVDLYHVHLPVLADHGIVDFDDETERVHYKNDEKTAVVVDRIRRQSPPTADTETN